MKNFAYRNNDYLIQNIPCKGFNPCCQNGRIENEDNRFGGFLLPFITGAVVSAPFWFVAGNNKAQYQYQSQPYPMYYPYQQYPQQAPMYYPYPPYR